MALDKPPALGHAVPATKHAISVQMPTWQDMCDMALGAARVKSVQQNGYPRSFLHLDVQQLTSICMTLLGDLDHCCLLFPSPLSAKACRSFLVLRQFEDHAKTQAVNVHVLRTAQNACDIKKGIFVPLIFAVVFPRMLLTKAMTFWRLSGTGISSRMATDCLKYADLLKETGRFCTESRWQQPWTRSHGEICKHIVNLLHRNPVESSRIAKPTSDDVFLYQSGMSAIYHTHQLLLGWRGSRSIVFGFPYELTLKMLETYGPGCTFYAFGTNDELGHLQTHLENEAAEGRTPQAMWCECPSNPLLRTPDLKKLRNLADSYGFVLVVDETIASFANVDLLGVADIIITSLTKSFSGYSNVMAGSVVLNPAGQYYDQLSASLRRRWRNDLYAGDAAQLELNSRDFLQRVAKVNNTASRLVQYFHSIRQEPQSGITAVYHPEVCWSVNNYRVQMRRPMPDFVPGYGGVFTLEFSSIAVAAAFFDASNIHKGPSLGANLTLMQPYVQTVFFKEKEWAARNGVRETIVRVSVGLEDSESLLEAFRAAMLEAKKVASVEMMGEGKLAKREEIDHPS